MTDYTEQQAVPVAREDMTLAKAIIEVEFDNSHAAYEHDVATVIARHRLASLPCKSGEGAGEIEKLAQFLHDEGGFGDAMTGRTWPEHDGDTGQRGDGWVKIVPSDVVAKFRDVARRWLLPRAALTPDDTQTREAEGEAIYRARRSVNEGYHHDKADLTNRDLRQVLHSLDAARAALNARGGA